ncbi:unnamed protein product, partial [Mesorhabditis spiculigera]
MGSDFVPLTLTEIMDGKRPENRPIRVLCEGVFDLFHIGHIGVLRQAKTAFPDIILVSGVNTDADVITYKGHGTVMSYSERLTSLENCRYVDEVLYDLPYVYDLEYLNRNQIDLVAHDDLPYIPSPDAPVEVLNFYDRFKV